MNFNMQGMLDYIRQAGGQMMDQYNQVTPQEHRKIAMDLVLGMMGEARPMRGFSRSTMQAPMDLLISHEGAPDINRVMEYKKILEQGGKIDPLKIIREGAKYGIEDGKHRFEALRQLGYKTAPIEFIKR